MSPGRITSLKDIDDEAWEELDRKNSSNGDTATAAGARLSSWTTCHQYLKKLFSSSLMTRPNKQEGLSLETLSSWASEFEGKARAYSIGAPFRCFLLGQAPGVTSNC